MNDASHRPGHRPGHRAGHHRGEPDARPRRWTTVLLAFVVVAAGIATAAPMAVAKDQQDALVSAPAAAAPQEQGSASDADKGGAGDPKDAPDSRKRSITPQAAAGSGVLNLTMKPVDASNGNSLVTDAKDGSGAAGYASGNSITYLVQYSCGTAACDGTQVQLTAPQADPGGFLAAGNGLLNYDSWVAPAGVSGATISGNDTTGKTVDLGDLAAGSSGTFTVTYTYMGNTGDEVPFGSFYPDGFQIQMGGTIASDTATGPKTAAAAAVTWHIGTPTGPTAGLTPGNAVFKVDTPVNLRVAVNPGNGVVLSGGCEGSSASLMATGNYTIVYHVPATAVIQSAANPSNDDMVIDNTAHTVTWTKGTLAAPVYGARAGWGTQQTSSINCVAAGTQNGATDDSKAYYGPRDVVVTFPSANFPGCDFQTPVQTSLDVDVNYLDTARTQGTITGQTMNASVACHSSYGTMTATKDVVGGSTTAAGDGIIDSTTYATIVPVPGGADVVRNWRVVVRNFGNEAAVATIDEPNLAPESHLKVTKITPTASAGAPADWGASVAWTRSDGTSGTTTGVSAASALTAPAGTWFTKATITTDPMEPVSVLPTDGKNSVATVQFQYAVDDGATIGTIVPNTAHVSMTYPGFDQPGDPVITNLTGAPLTQPVTLDVSRNVQFVQPSAQVNARFVGSPTIANGGQLNAARPDTPVTWTVSASTAQVWPGSTITPQVIFAAPRGWTIVPNSAAMSAAAPAGVTFAYTTKVINGETRDVVIATWPNEQTPSNSASTTYGNLSVAAVPTPTAPTGVPSQALSLFGDASEHWTDSVNNFAATPNQYSPAPNAYADASDLDGDGNTTEDFALQFSGSAVEVAALPALSVTKEICNPDSGQPDGCNWQQAGAGSPVQVTNNDDIKYRLTMSNAGNVDLTNVLATDVLPNTADGRGSEFNQTLTGASATDPGLVLDYSASTSPGAGDWTAAQTGAKAVRFAAASLPIGDALSTIFTTRQSPGATLGQVGCNSLGTDSDQTLNVNTGAVCAQLAPADPTAGVPWTCTPDGQLFQSTTTTDPTTVTPINLVTGQPSAAPTVISDDQINAVGYNTLDNFFYGWDQTANQLVRINGDFTTTLLGAPAGMDATAKYVIGDFDDQGHLWLADNIGLPYHEIDLAPGSATFGELLDTGTMSMPAGISIPGLDWTFLDGAFYSVAFNGTPPKLMKFDPTTHVVSNLGVVPGATNAVYGATYSDGTFVYASNNTTGLIYRIDPTSLADTVVFAHGPAADLNDGGRCLNAPLPIDFGDAPDSFGTTLASDGPRHQVVDGLHLGADIDDETDGQPGATADGDGADEDGVSGPISATTGQPLTVTVSVTNTTDQPATLVGWTDRNGNGSFGTGERVIVNVPANSGADDYDVNFPVGTEGGATYARFRLFPGTVAPAGALPTGPAAGGEVEDYPVEAAAQLDFGDAPNSYGTTLASDGPRHTVTPGLTIGSLIDFDADGQPTADATGDDADQTADEDAFESPSVLNPGVTSASLSVPVTNTTGGPATLSGWIDANDNGRFDPSEFASVAVPDGATSVDLAFNGIPALQDGTRPIMRLRLTTDTLPADNPVTPNDERALGSASDGEVEDHVAQVATLVPLSCVDPFTETFGMGAGWGPPLPAGQTTYDYANSRDASGFLPAGAYGLVPDPRIAHVAWMSGEDHTPDDTDGRMMVVNAAEDPGLFFQRTFTGLSTGATYDFSAWLANVLSNEPQDHPNVTFRVVDPATGNQLAQVTTGDVPSSPVITWQRFALQFTATQSTVRLELVNNTPHTSGNDLAIDDIAFTPVCEFGDAPARYGTLIADDGAGHVAAGPTLGTERDTETDGQPNPAADGDDSAGTPDDEDAVAAPISMSVGSGPTVSVSATNDSDEDVTLAGWIDLDGNGAFDPAERVLVTVPANAGTDDYDLVFPAVTTTTDTYARFRIYGEDVADPQPTGTASAGEVEDYPVTVLTQSLAITKSSDATADSRPGDVISYTITATNNGLGDYTASNPARVFDDLTGVLDDADYQGDAEADRAPTTPAYAAPVLSWTGALPAGESVTITYKVKLKGGGDGTVRNVAFGQECDPADPGCDTTTPECDPPAGGIDPVTGEPCAEEVFDLPKLSIAKRADHTALPSVGETVTYTVEVTNEGPGDYTATAPATATDDLSDVLDDATGPVDIQASTGDATFDSGTSTLTWTGALEAGDTATITYEVTYTGAGDQLVVNLACVPVEEAQDPQDPCASASIPGSGLDQDKVSTPASGTAVEPGEVITYTLRFASTGKTAADVDTFDDLAGVLDDADFLIASISAEAGLTATYDDPGKRINVTGSVAVGETLEVTYQVKVKAFAAQGDHLVRNALQCEPGDPTPCDPETTEHPVRALEIEKTSDRTAATVVGDTVTYTVTAKNVGEGDYTGAEPARVWDDMSGVLDDALYNNDVETVPAGVGTLTYTSPVVEWSGALVKGATVTFTYTVKLTGADDLNVRNVAFGQCDPADADCDTTTPVCDPPNADGVDPATGKPCAEVEFGLPKMEESKSVNPADGSAVKAGDTLTYTLTFENTGTAGGEVSKDDYVGLLLDDAEITVDPSVDVTGGSGTVTADVNGDRIEIRGGLGAGATATVSYTVKVKPDVDRARDGDDQLGNFLIEPGDTPPTPADCDPANTDEDATCNPVSRLVDSKSVSPADGTAVKAGDELTYTLTFSNLGKGAGEVDRVDYLGLLIDDATLESGPTVSPAGGLTADLNPAADRIHVSGSLGAGHTVTVSYTVKVKPDVDRARDGDDQLGNFLIEPGDTPPTPADCDPANTDEDATCNPVSRIVDHKSVDPADGSSVEAGDVLTYTLTVENLGKGAGAVGKDDYVGMLLDDAEITAAPVVTITGGDGDVDATVDGDLIELRGDLDAGATATITYSVRVKSDGQRAADGGDDMLGNFLIEPGTTPPTECEDESEQDSTCNPVRELKITKSSDRAEGATFGDVVTYTVTAENTGQADYTTADPALVRDLLTGVLDDAVYNGDAVADLTGTLHYNSPVIRWEGALSTGEKVTITYTVTLKKGGDGNVRNVAWGGHGADPKCDPRTADGFDPVTGQACGIVEFGRPDLVDSKSVNPASGTPVVAGQRLTYTLTFTNDGTAPGEVDKVDDLSGVLDDATLVAAPTASTADLSVGAVKDGKLSITGTLKPGQSAMVTYGVQVNARGSLGDKSLGNYLLDPGAKPRTECVTGEDSTCNPVGEISMVKTVDPKDGSKVEVGDKLTYTLTFTNTGKGAGTVDAVDDLTDVLDDAALVAGTGKVSDPALTVVDKGSRFRIRGTLAGGQSVAVVYTIKVKAYGDQGNHALLNFLTGPNPPRVSQTKCTSGDPLCTDNPVKRPEVAGGSLANTGGPALGFLIGGLILVVSGGFLLRRRRREAH
jgi:uncharacterized repeat protein (TIGR01451 family)/fimbrial isopeptide formation D2 family protein/LPXTG-motif cell wall-anchored protein